MPTSGPNSASTIVQENYVLGTISWTNIGNVSASDNVRATAVGTGQNTYTHYIKATGFGFSVPTNDVIDGILVEVEGHNTGAPFNVASYVEVRAVKGGTIQGANRGTGSLGSSDAYNSFGSTTDKWNLSWVPSDINASGFGTAFAFLLFNASANANIDHVRITVYHSEPVSVIAPPISAQAA